MKNKQKIYLIGYRGAGKTTLARMFSESRKCPAVDLDELISEKAEKTIPEIFQESGESGFRNLEEEVLLETSKRDFGGSVIIASGGGIVLRENNRKIIKESGVAVFLSVSPEDAAERIRGDSNRPSLTGLEFEEEIRRLIEFREPLYKETADFIINTSEYSISERVKLLGNFLKWPGTVKR